MKRLIGKTWFSDGTVNEIWREFRPLFHNIVFYHSIDGDFLLGWGGFSDNELKRLVAQELRIRSDSPFSLKVLGLLGREEGTEDKEER